MTNKKTGEVIYTGIHPISKQPFYAGRSWNYDGNLDKGLSSGSYYTGSLRWFHDNPNAVWFSIELDYQPVFY